MSDSDEEIYITQNSFISAEIAESDVIDDVRNHTGLRKLRLPRSQIRIKLFHIILQLTLHSDDKLCVYCM